MLKRRVVGMFVAMLLASLAVTATETAAQGQGNSGTLSVPIVGAGPGATFAGVLNITRFVRSGDQVLALGTVSGTLTNTATNVVRTVVTTVAIPLNLPGSGGLNGVCEILSLVLGPIDLDLLGLVVHVDQIVVNIDAQPGPGNLLGNLLCAVAGLLDGGGPLGQLVARLNQILGALG
jgi:hypothetical protein